MSNFLVNLVARSRGAQGEIAPRLGSRFEPSPLPPNGALLPPEIEVEWDAPAPPRPSPGAPHQAAQAPRAAEAAAPSVPFQPERLAPPAPIGTEDQGDRKAGLTVRPSPIIPSPAGLTSPAAGQPTRIDPPRDAGPPTPRPTAPVRKHSPAGRSPRDARNAPAGDMAPAALPEAPAAGGGASRASIEEAVGISPEPAPSLLEPPPILRRSDRRGAERWFEPVVARRGELGLEPHRVGQTESNGSPFAPERPEPAAVVPVSKRAGGAWAPAASIPCSSSSPSVDSPRPRPTETIVQVSIGRIEVRATPPAASPPPHRPAPGVLGLSDYLEQRGREGRR